MLKTLNRIKRAWELSKREEEISNEELKAFLAEPVGDGQATFLPDMTEAEYEAYERDEVRGWGKFWGKK